MNTVNGQYNYSDVKTNVQKDKATVKKIIVKTQIDNDYYPEYLEQFKDSTDPQEQQHYIEDKKRLEDFNNGKYCYVGIKAIAVVHIGVGNGSVIIQHIISGGLWGIESDSEQSYKDEIAKEQLEEVKHYLRILNVEEIDTAAIEYKEEV